MVPVAPVRCQSGSLAGHRIVPRRDVHFFLHVRADWATVVPFSSHADWGCEHAQVDTATEIARVPSLLAVMRPIYPSLRHCGPRTCPWDQGYETETLSAKVRYGALVAFRAWFAILKFVYAWVARPRATSPCAVRRSAIEFGAVLARRG